MKVFFQGLQRICLTLFFSLALGCTNAVTSINGLSLGVLSPPKFSNSTEVIYVIPTFNSPVTVSGTCDEKSEGLLLSFDSGVTWSAPPPTGADLDCSDETFSFIFPDASTYLPITGATSPGTQFPFLLRAMSTTLGVSSNSTVIVQLQSAFKILAGDTNSAGASQLLGSSYKIKSARFGSSTENKVMVGASYKIRVNEEN